MAIINRNALLLQGAQGKIGDITYRTRNGVTHAYVAKKNEKPASEKQKQNRAKFGKGVKFAQEVKKDEQLNKEYKKKAKYKKKEGAYTMAISEYMKKKE